jgi:hypothetical protein
VASTFGAPYRFDVGRVIQRAFAAIGHNFAVFALLSLLLAGLPSALTGGLLNLATQGPSTSPTPTGATGDELAALGASVFALAYLASAVGGLILTAALVHGAVADLNGRRAGFGECLATGVRNAFWLFLIGLIVAVAEVFGYLLFVVPGIMVATAWISAVPVRVVERLGPFGALGRSAELTRGHRWAIFGLIVIYLLGSWMLQGAVLAVIGSLAEAGPTALPVNALVLQPLVAAATHMVSAAGVASIYYELRSGREGIGPEALAAVFD